MAATASHHNRRHHRRPPPDVCDGVNIKLRRKGVVHTAIICRVHVGGVHFSARAAQRTRSGVLDLISILMKVEHLRVVVPLTNRPGFFLLYLPFRCCCFAGSTVTGSHQVHNRRHAGADKRRVQFPTSAVPHVSIHLISLRHAVLHGEPSILPNIGVC